MRAGTSIGANNAEATSAISKADFKSKSFIALKEAREPTQEREERPSSLGLSRATRRKTKSIGKG